MMIEAPAKRAKPTVTPTERITHSDSRINTVNLFNEDMGTTVCPFAVTNILNLTTSPADQGECFGVQSSLVFGYGSTYKCFDKPVATDQKGRACVADSLPRNLFCRRVTLKSIPPLLYWAICAVMILSLVNSAAAVPSATSALSFFALNTNGFVHPMKIDATNRAITHRNPDVIVITETKTNSPRASKMPSDYQYFEDRGVPVSGGHLFKWGVILGIKNGIAVSQRVHVTHPALSGRLVAVDIVIPLDTGDGFVHRVIAAYAPWDVSDNADTAAFWAEASKLCNASPNTWTLLGDLNATVTQAEHRSGGTDA
jgi:hypothetical protein